MPLFQVEAFGITLVVGFLAVRTFGWMLKPSAPFWQFWLFCIAVGTLLIGLLGVVQTPFSSQRALEWTIVGFISGVLAGPFMRLLTRSQQMARGGQHVASNHKNRLPRR